MNEQDREAGRIVTEREIFDSHYLSQHNVCVDLAEKQVEKILLKATLLCKCFTETASISDIVGVAQIISAQTAQLNIVWDKNSTKIEFLKNKLQKEIDKK